MSTSTTSPTDSERHIRDFLEANPSLDAALGDVNVMTDRYTNQEWAEQIKETQSKVLSEVEQRAREGGKGWKYDVPEVEDGGLAKTMDHTVLKLDANQGTIDSLCAEARVEGFKVSRCFVCWQMETWCDWYLCGEGHWLVWFRLDAIKSITMG